MECDVSTGALMCTPSQGGSGDSRFRNDVVFDAHSASRFSGVFSVGPGSMLIVSVFDLAGGSMRVHKVVIATGQMPQGVSCPGPCEEPSDDSLPGAFFPTVIYQKPVVTNGVPWVMSDDDDTKLVTTPGAYRFELSDDALIGETYVEARLVRGGMMPSQMVFGSQTGAHAAGNAAENAAGDVAAGAAGDAAGEPAGSAAGDAA